MSDEVLEIQRCRRCEQYQYYPRQVCRHCGSRELALVPASGQGVVHSYTIVERSPVPYLEPPYVVAIIRLAEGPTLMSHVVDVDPEQLRCEQPVELRWRQYADDIRLPVFTPASTRKGA